VQGHGHGYGAGQGSLHEAQAYVKAAQEQLEGGTSQGNNNNNNGGDMAGDGPMAGGVHPHAPPPRGAIMRPSPRPGGHPAKRKKVENSSKQRTVDEKANLAAPHGAAPTAQKILSSEQIDDLRRQQNASLLSVLELERQLEAAREKRLADAQGADKERLEILIGEERAAASQRIMDVVGHHEKELKMRMAALNLVG
jgi:hypothetical protein